jgi:hypothetical protein
MGGYNEKSRLQLRPVGTLSKSTTRLLDKAERMCKRPQSLLLPTATIALYHNLLECCQVILKIFFHANRLARQAFTRFNPPRERRKRLNTSAGLSITRAKN